MKYDKHTTQRHFIVGDLVWVAITMAQIGENSISGKLQPRYQGPCRIVKQIGPSTFIVQRLRDGVDLGAINADRLKIYFEQVVESQRHATTNAEQIASTALTTDADQNRSSTPITNEEQTNTPYNSPISTTLQNSSTLINQAAQRPVSSRQRKMPARYLQ